MKKTTRLVWKTISFGLGILLLWSGVRHIANPSLFLETIIRYQIFPCQLAKFVAIYLPFGQALIGSYLILGVGKRFASFVSLFLFSSFFGVQTSAWVRGLGIDCGCFGASDHPIDWVSVSTALVFAILAVLQFWFSLKNEYDDYPEQKIGAVQ